MKLTALAASVAFGLGASLAAAQGTSAPATPPAVAPAVVTAPAATLPASAPVTNRPVMTPGNDLPAAGAIPPPAPVSGTAAAPLVPGSAVPNQAVPVKQPGFFDSPLLLIPLVFLAVMIIPQLFTGRKEKKRRELLLKELAHGDRVMTGGGIIGTIVELRDDEVVLKTDEGSNTKIRFTRSAVQQVIRKQGGPASTAETKPAAAELAKS